MISKLIEQLQRLEKEGSEIVGGTLVYIDDKGETKFIIADPSRKTVNHWSKINFK